MLASASTGHAATPDPQGSSDEGAPHDVVIYGGTSAAITAAIQAARMGQSVVVVSPDKHLGGLTTSGLGWTDVGAVESIGGLSREFYHRVWRYYRQPEVWKWQRAEAYRAQYGHARGSASVVDDKTETMWAFEPHVAEAVFEDWLKEFKVDVVRNAWLDREKGVVKQGDRIVSIRTLDGRAFAGRMFLDATYEGDLMAAAGVSYHVGREANRIYGEKWNGVQVGTLHHLHHFGVLNKPISPYKSPGDPTSGLLPYVSAKPPGTRGEGDRRVQAYCFRMCLTDDPANRVPFPKPEGYNPDNYELLRRILDAGWNDAFRKFDKLPNRKTDTNNNGPFSTDFIGMNYDYPEASYQRRREIIEEHKRYQQGLMYFLANDPRVPEAVRKEASRWGLAKDEFSDNGHWPHQLYIREARRMVGRYVMTEHDCFNKRATPNPVGLASYTVDSHNVQRYVTPEGHVQNEGDIGVRVPEPYEIAYGSIIPKPGECSNLLVPVCVSSSHTAFGSVRMEPVFMILGQSAATVAALCNEQGVDVQSLDYDTLRYRLLKDGQRLGRRVRKPND
ncbi:MAG: FAD-dependent oxidoreductase [Pirellulales bacterium]|nr:FAD-dependent oxidoreductase [Pirellulales bacterium]